MKVWVHFEAPGLEPSFGHGYFNVPAFVCRAWMWSLVYAMRKTGRLTSGWPLEDIRAMSKGNGGGT